MSTTEPKDFSRVWDEVRMGFHTSIMVDTSLNSLAQNLDAPDWPLAGEDETPAKYIDLPYEELVRFPGMAGHPERVASLISILRETLAFDNPFGEMVDQTAKSVAQENPLQKNLAKLGIPEAFPMEYVLISEETQEFCRLEKITTLGEFADFAQNMPPQVIVGGDFRSFLNALAHINEEALAGFLPFRPGARGLHLVQAINQMVGKFPAAERAAVARRFGASLPPEEAAQAATISRDRVRETMVALRERTVSLVRWFSEDLAELVSRLKAGGALERELMPLADPTRERIVASLLEPALREAGVGQEVKAEARERGGFFSRLFRKQ